RAEKLTNSVLGMARRRGNETAPTDLAALVAESLVLLERELAKYRVQVETAFATDRRACVAPTQIQQVLLNLLTNARQAMPRGGGVRIGVAEAADGEHLLLTVEDTGSGIPPEVLPRVFDRDFSTKSGPDATGKGGAGLGLAACKEIVEGHGGSIRVESTPGQGTTFTLRLPAMTEPAEKPPIVSLGVPTASPTATPAATPNASTPAAG
ncbi:MAG: ATP-binding protein, partial [Planctomycetota bacterium]